MVEGGFQEEAEARAKYDRARLSSTQLSTYFAGSMEMWDLELEARRRAAGPPVPIRRDPAGRAAGRLRRHAGVPLPPPPRGRHRARRPADRRCCVACSTSSRPVERLEQRLDPVARLLGSTGEPVHHPRVRVAAGLDGIEADCPREEATKRSRSSHSTPSQVLTPIAARTGSRASQPSSRRRSACARRDRGSVDGRGSASSDPHEVGRAPRASLRRCRPTGTRRRRPEPAAARRTTPRSSGRTSAPGASSPMRDSTSQPRQGRRGHCATAHSAPSRYVAGRLVRGSRAAASRPGHP